MAIPPAAFVRRVAAKGRNQHRAVSTLTNHRLDVHVRGSEREWLSAQVLAHRVQMEPSMTKFTTSANRGVKRECQSNLKTDSAMGAKVCCHPDVSNSPFVLKDAPLRWFLGRELHLLTEHVCILT